jgi:hypothetical protein
MSSLPPYKGHSVSRMKELFKQEISSLFPLLRGQFLAALICNRKPTESGDHKGRWYSNEK